MMTNETNGSASEAADNITEHSARLFNEVAAWVTGNFEDIVLASAIGIGIALVLLALRGLGCRIMGSRAGNSHWPVIFARVLAKTSFPFTILVSAELVAEHAGTPPAILGVINFLFIVVASFQAAIWARELVLGFIEHRVGIADEHSTLGSAMGIVRLLVSVALFAIAIILILDNLGVNVTGLVAGLGIGGIAIGLAAQGIFSDLFAALSIIFDRPFRRGQTITFGTTTGTVEQIGLKSTRIRSLSGEEVVISNANLLNMQVQNWALLERRRALMTFGVVYQTPVDLLARISGEIREIVNEEPDATFDRCHAFQFGASSIDYELVFHVESADYAAFMQARQNIMLAIMRRFQEMGVEFAYPTQTTFTAAPDGRLIMPYPHVKMLATGDIGSQAGSAPENA